MIEINTLATEASEIRGNGPRVSIRAQMLGDLQFYFWHLV
jgi:hypothetical protein